MNLDAYQRATGKTAVYPGQRALLDAPNAQGLSYVTLGLAGEAGEIANKVKKILRDFDSQVSHQHQTALMNELGDVLWYVSQLATELGVSLACVAKENLAKLAGRAERGTLQGSGDNR